MAEVSVDVADLPVGKSRMIDRDGHRFLVCRSARGVHASAGLCPHQVKSLEGARVRGDLLMCLHHGAMFRLDTGASQSFALTARSLAIYPAHLDGDTLRVTVPD